MRAWMLAVLWGCLLCLFADMVSLTILPGQWKLVMVSVATGMYGAAGASLRLRKYRLTKEAAAPRTPAFPAGRACPPGCCPICGQDEPAALTPCWGALEAHESCVEWLGRGPGVAGLTMAEASANLFAATGSLKRRFPTVPGVRPSEMREILAEMGNPRPHPTEDEIYYFIERKAREQRDAWMAACQHESVEEVHSYGSGRWRLCRRCGTDVTPVRPTPPPGPGSATTAK